MMPGADESPWTAVVTNKPILNGHFVEHLMKADIGGGMIYEMRNLFGWDPETGRPVGVMLTNMDGGTALESRWVGARTQVILHSGIDGDLGVPYADHWVTKYEDDGFTMTIHRALGDGAPFLHISGQFRRVKDGGGQAGAAEASMAFGPPPPMMQKLAPLVGDYAVSGKLSPGPGAPDIRIVGHETVAAAMGNQVLSLHTTGGADGAPPTYEGQSYLYWNAADKCYKSFSMANSGEFHCQDANWDGDEALVFISAGRMGGVPTVIRGILEVDAERGITGIETQSLAGMGPLAKVFEARYSREE